MKKEHTKLTGVAPFIKRCAVRATGWASISALAMATAVQPIAVSSVSAQSQGNPNHIVITAENASIPKIIRLGLDKSLVVDLPADAHDVLVANPTVADAITRTSRRIYLFGKEIGQTNVFVFDGSGNQIASMEILIERDIAGLEETITRLVPNSDVRAEMINDNIVLTGRVQTPQAAAKAISLAQIFIKGGEQTNNNSSSGLAAIFGDEPESQIVNLLKIDGEDQVHLKVTIAEIQRTVIKQLGINTISSNPTDDGFGFSTALGGIPQQLLTANTGGSLGVTHGLNTIQSQLKALESVGVMRTLAEPSLTAISGEEANFNVGGRLQQPAQIENNDNGGVDVRYETLEYGISLNFKPVVLTEGRISLKIETEVKEPTAQGASLITNRGNLNGIRHRQASTTVELPSGGSMVIAGLIQDDVRQVVSGIPGIKNIPVLGSLFRSREFIRNESEVVIVVTPYLVRPVARTKIAQPDDNFMPAADGAGYFMGRVNRVYGTKQGNLPKGRYTGSIGFILK